MAPGTPLAQAKSKEMNTKYRRAAKRRPTPQEEAGQKPAISSVGLGLAGQPRRRPL